MKMTTTTVRFDSSKPTVGEDMLDQIQILELIVGVIRMSIVAVVSILLHGY